MTNTFQFGRLLRKIREEKELPKEQRTMYTIKRRQKHPDRLWSIGIYYLGNKHHVRMETRAQTVKDNKHLSNIVSPV